MELEEEEDGPEPTTPERKPHEFDLTTSPTAEIRPMYRRRLLKRTYWQSRMAMSTDSKWKLLHSSFFILYYIVVLESNNNN